MNFNRVNAFRETIAPLGLGLKVFNPVFKILSYAISDEHYLKYEGRGVFETDMELSDYERGSLEMLISAAPILYTAIGYIAILEFVPLTPPTNLVTFLLLYLLLLGTSLIDEISINPVGGDPQ